MSVVKRNMMKDPHYRPYCGNPDPMKCPKMPRTIWNKDHTQFKCPNCNWESNFPKAFMDEYHKTHKTKGMNPPLTEEEVQKLQPGDIIEVASLEHIVADDYEVIGIGTYKLLYVGQEILVGLDGDGEGEVAIHFEERLNLPKTILFDRVDEEYITITKQEKNQKENR